jgi:hypothetical protein
MTERHAYFDPTPLALAMAARPLAAAPLVRALIAQRRNGRANAAPDARPPQLGRALAGLAAGRIALGALSRFAPRRGAELFGAGTTMTPELDYMSRVFGARAFALGAGYLTSSGAARRRWQRLAFVCDVSDTVAGIGALRRGDVSRSSALALTAMTGGYALIGAARIAHDMTARTEDSPDV